MFLSTESGKPLHKSPNTKKIQIGRLFGIYQPNWWYGYLFSLQNKQTKHTQMLSRLWGKDDFQSITRQRTWTNFKHFATWGTWNLRFFLQKMGEQTSRWNTQSHQQQLTCKGFRTAEGENGVNHRTRAHDGRLCSEGGSVDFFGNWWTWVRGAAFAARVGGRR